jgi:hypothetical protein
MASSRRRGSRSDPFDEPEYSYLNPSNKTPRYLNGDGDDEAAPAPGGSSPRHSTAPRGGPDEHLHSDSHSARDDAPQPPPPLHERGRTAKPQMKRRISRSADVGGDRGRSRDEPASWADRPPRHRSEQRRRHDTWDDRDDERDRQCEPTRHRASRHPPPSAMPRNLGGVGDSRPRPRRRFDDDDDDVIRSPRADGRRSRRGSVDDRRPRRRSLYGDDGSDDDDDDAFSPHRRRHAHRDDGRRRSHAHDHDDDNHHRRSHRDDDDDDDDHHHRRRSHRDDDDDFDHPHRRHTHRHDEADDDHHRHRRRSHMDDDDDDFDRPRRRHTHHHHHDDDDDDLGRPRRRHSHHHRDDDDSRRRHRRSHARSSSADGYRSRHEREERGRGRDRDSNDKEKEKREKDRASSRARSILGKVLWSAALQAGFGAAMDMRQKPGPWMGEKGARVASAAVTSGLVDSFFENKKPDRKGGLRHQAAKMGFTEALGLAASKAASRGA